MKKILLSILFLVGSYLQADINAVVSILPQKTFLEKIGGEKVNVALMVKPGNSPHTYEPKPSQMKAIGQADIYFSIGVEFEHAWLPRFQSQNKKMKLANMGKDIHKIEMLAHKHHDKEHKHNEHSHKHHDDHGHDHKHGSFDPHIWLSPKNVKIIAKNTLTYLVRIDKKNKEYYQKNYENFIASINETDKTLQEILSKIPKHSKFMVFHPSWGYFAKDYHLEQVAIETEGKSPKPKEIKHIIEEAKEEKIRAIFTSPEFSDAIASQIAKELNIPVIPISPLNPKWSQNLINFAKAIAY